MFKNHGPQCDPRVPQFAGCAGSALGNGARASGPHKPTSTTPKVGNSSHCAVSLSEGPQTQHVSQMSRASRGCGAFRRHRESPLSSTFVLASG